MRSEATAEASLARRRERRKLGIAMAEMIKMTDTTISSSIREKPLCFRMSPPEASIRDTRPGDATPRKSPSGGQACGPDWNLNLHHIRTVRLGSRLATD